MIQRLWLLFVMVLYLPTFARAEDWPQWRGPDRTGVSKEKGLLQAWPAGGPKLLWTFRNAGAGHSSMAVVGDRLYAMGVEGDKEHVYAIDLKTQKKLWSTAVGAPFITQWIKGPTSTPTIDGNLLYGMGGHGNLVCVETASGKKVWSKELVADLGGVQPSDSYTESPLVDGDLVIVTPSGKKGTLAALDKKTGTVKWRSPAYARNDTVNGSMIAIQSGGVRQYVQITWNFIAGLCAADGHLLWRKRVAGRGINTPIYHPNDCVFIPVAGGSLVKLMHIPNEDNDEIEDKFKAEQLYAGKELGYYFSGVILVGQHLYGYSEGGGWACQDLKTGKTIWIKNPGKDMGNGSLCYADGNLYGYHENKGDVLLIKATPDGYREQGRFRIPEVTKLPRASGKIWSSPVVANGKLYLRDNDLIFCYDVRKPSTYIR